MVTVSLNSSVLLITFDMSWSFMNVLLSCKTKKKISLDGLKLVGFINIYVSKQTMHIYVFLKYKLALTVWHNVVALSLDLIMIFI